MSQIQITSPRYALVGLGGILTSVLAFLLSGLANFHFREYIPIPLGGLIVTAGLTVTCAAALRSARAAADEQERQLDAALAGWPPKTVGELSPFDLGVRPRTDGAPGDPYQARSEDLEIENALMDAPMILLVGPPGAGKTRSAQHAAHARLPEATLLAPMDGPALNTLLAYRDWLTLPSGARVVLWLDSLERFFDGLDLDSLQRLTLELGPRLTPWLRARRSLSAWFAAERGRVAPLDLGDDTRAHVTVLATVREDTLDQALDGDGARAYVARRLLARMTTIPIAPRPQAHPSSPTAQTASDAGPTGARDGQRVGGIGVGRRDADLRPSAPSALVRPRVGRASVAALIALFLLWVGALAALVGHDGGWLAPPSLTAQAKAIEGSVLACQTVRGEPAAARLSEGEAWTLMVSSSGCPAPDSIRYYRVEHGTLEEQFTERPSSSAPWRFHCLGPSGSCRVSVPGGAPVLLGAFESSVSAELLPIVLYGSSYGRVLTYSPFLPPPPRDALDSSRPGNGPTTLALLPGAASSLDPHAPRSCRRAALLCSYPVDFLAAEPADESHGALLIAGYVRAGTIYRPLSVDVRVYGLRYDAQHDLTLDPRYCLFFSEGNEQSSRQLARLKPNVEVAEQIRAMWTPRAGADEAVIC